MYDKSLTKPWNFSSKLVNFLDENEIIYIDKQEKKSSGKLIPLYKSKKG